MRKNLYKPGQLYTIRNTRTGELQSYRIVKDGINGCFGCTTGTIAPFICGTICLPKLPLGTHLQVRMGIVTFKMINCEHGCQECSFRLGTIVSDYSYVVTYKHVLTTTDSNKIVQTFNFLGIFRRKNGDPYSAWQEIKTARQIPEVLRKFLQKGEFKQSLNLSVRLCDHLCRCQVKELCYHAPSLSQTVTVVKNLTSR